MSVNVQQVSYGGVSLPLCTIGFHGRAEYDQSGRVLQGYSLSFRGSCFVTAGAGGTPANTKSNLAAVLEVMARPRLTFLWTSGGTTLFQIAPSGTAGNTHDERRHGPKPRVTGVKQVPGGLSARVDFEIDTFVYPCSDALIDLEEFWWTYRYSFDRHFACVRTITGQYRVRSPLNAGVTFLMDGGFWPALPNGFHRDSAEHQLSPDGSVITWTITDRQDWRTLPRPLTGGEATFRIEQRGARIDKMLNCTFEAPIDTDKRVLLQFIVALVKARFPGVFEPVGGVSEYFTMFSITNDEFANRVSCSVSSTQAAIKNRTGSALELLGWGDVADVAPAGGDAWAQIDNRSELAGMTGTAGLIPRPQPAFNICDSFSPYADYFSPSALDESPGRMAAGSPGASTTPNSSPDRSSFSTEHQQGPYTGFCETWTYLLDHHLAILPVAKADVLAIPQQTANPTLRVIQVGHASRIGQMPKFPDPAYVGQADAGSTPTARVLRQERHVDDPKLLADGATVEYRIRWVYEIAGLGVTQFSPGGGGDPLAITDVLVPRTPILSPSQWEEVKGAVVGPNVGKDGSY